MPERKVRKRRQRGGFLNRYNLASAGQDTINTSLKSFKRIVPGYIENAGNKIDKVTKKRIAQITSQGGKELDRVAPIITKIFWAVVQDTFLST